MTDLNLSAWMRNERAMRESYHQFRALSSKIVSPFSFERLDALSALLEWMRLVGDADLRLFFQFQESEQHSVVRLLLKHVLQQKPPAPSTPLSPVSTGERVVALEILQGMCIGHPPTRALLLSLDAIEGFAHDAAQTTLELLDAASTPAVLHTVVLDAALAMCVDTPGCQEAFDKATGVDRIARLARKTSTTSVRHKCAECLAFILRYWTADAPKLKIATLLGDKLAEQLGAAATLAAPDASAELWLLVEKKLKGGG